MTYDPIRSMVDIYSGAEGFDILMSAIAGSEELSKDDLVARLYEKNPVITNNNDYVHIVFANTGLGDIALQYKPGPHPELYPEVNDLPLPGIERD